MSERGKIYRTSTSRGLIRFEVEVRHHGLHKYQIIRGDDPYVVEQKAKVLARAWDEQWKKKSAAANAQADRAKRMRAQQQKKAYAEEQTLKAQERLQELQLVLRHTLSVDDAINWESLKDRSEFPEPRPAKPQPPQAPKAPTIPRQPRRDEPRFIAQLGLLDKLISSRRRAKEDDCQRAFENAVITWQKQKAALEEAHAKAIKEHELALLSFEKTYADELLTWERRREKFMTQQNATNTAIDAKRTAYERGDPEAVMDYCDMVLRRSEYPEYFPQTYELDYNPLSAILIVDYLLPPKEALPTVKEVKYVRSKDDFDEKEITEAQLNKLYDDLLYQITLRTVHELFEADKVNALSAIVFNGYVESIDPATGVERRACVLSLQASKDEFMGINLAHVDPKLCFRNLKGLGSSKLHSITPVAPILSIERDDKRFVSSYEVAHGLDEGVNLAMMDWEDFEHLIREVFEKEFLAAGGEVKVTQASRDGGVDAVVFDPDPIKGGKFVIQAKRYSNTVGVAAVRDLYGTMINEGANKGILVSTADFGPDAYEFARGKPLTLLNGGNLLHLLEKHGHKARIDLKEAKLAAQQQR